MNDRYNPKHPLHGAFTKHQRADEQAIALRALIESNGHNDRGHRLLKEETVTERIYRYEPIPLPLMWSVMLGEIVHNCRSALDHVVTQLMLLRNPTERPNRANAFPVHLTKELFDEHSPRQLRGLSPDDRNMIETFQPYKADESDIAPNATPVYLLEQLWNIDKHRLVQLLISDESLTLTRLEVTPLSGLDGEWLHPLGSLKRGAIVYRRPGRGPSPEYQITCYVNRPVCISDTGDAKPSTTNIGEILDTIVAFTDDVLTQADRRFPINY